MKITIFIIVFILKSWL